MASRFEYVERGRWRRFKLAAPVLVVISCRVPTLLIGQEDRKAVEVQQDGIGKWGPEMRLAMEAYFLNQAQNGNSSLEALRIQVGILEANGNVGEKTVAVQLVNTDAFIGSRLEKEAARIIDQARDEFQLDLTETEKLEFAARSDIARLLVDRSKAYEECLRLAADGANNYKAMEAIAHGINIRFKQQTFGDGSLLQKSLNRIVTEERRRQFEQRVYFSKLDGYAAVASAIELLNRYTPLSRGRRERLRSVLERDLQNVETSSNAIGYAGLLLLSQLSATDVDALLDREHKATVAAILKRHELALATMQR